MACGGLLFAQEQPQTLSLADARTLALKNHPQVLAAQALSGRANQLTREARSAYYPALNGEITGAQANADSRLGAGVLNDPRLFTHFGSGLTLSQLITDSGRTPNLVAEAKLRYQASQQDIEASRYDVIFGVDQAYYGVLLAEQLVTVSEQTVSARQSVVDQATELFKNKLKSQIDLSFAQVNLTDAKLMQIRAQDRLSEAYAELAQTLGSQQVVRYQLTDTAIPVSLPETPDPLIAQAFQNRPELASIRLQHEADEKFANAERDLKRPSVNVMAVGGALPYIQPGNANANIPDGYEAAAVNITIPVFNGHLFAARRAAAEEQAVATNERARDLQNRVARDVRNAWSRARSAYEAIGATKDLLQQSNLALSLAQGRYNLGLASIVELTQAQLAQTEAQVQNVSATYEYENAYAALQYAMGSLH